MMQEIKDMGIGNNYKEYINSMIQIKIKNDLVKPNIKYSLNMQLIKCIADLIIDFPEIMFYAKNNIIHTHKKINIGTIVSFKNNSNISIIPDVNNVTLEELYKIYKQNLMDIICGKYTLKYKPSVVVSNLYYNNVDMFIPVLFRDTSCSIGISSPVNNTFNLCAVFDHRIHSGDYIARFLNKIKEGIEDG